jgi:hypothetical protein
LFATFQRCQSRDDEDDKKTTTKTSSNPQLSTRKAAPLSRFHIFPPHPGSTVGGSTRHGNAAAVLSFMSLPPLSRVLVPIRSLWSSSLPSCMLYIIVPVGFGACVVHSCYSTDFFHFPSHLSRRTPPSPGFSVIAPPPIRILRYPPVHWLISHSTSSLSSSAFSAHSLRFPIPIPIHCGRCFPYPPIDLFPLRLPWVNADWCSISTSALGSPPDRPGPACHLPPLRALFYYYGIKETILGCHIIFLLPIIRQGFVCSLRDTCILHCIDLTVTLTFFPCL